MCSVEIVNAQNGLAHSPDFVLFPFPAQSSETKSDAVKAAPEEIASPTRKVSTSDEMTKPRQLTLKGTKMILIVANAATMTGGIQTQALRRTGSTIMIRTKTDG